MLARKTVTLVEEYQYISQQDAAVNRDTPDFAEKWEKYLDGTAEPPLLVGSEPTVFTLKHLSTPERAVLTDGVVSSDSGVIAATSAFFLGVVGVKNYQAKDGSPLKLEFEMNRDLGVTPVRVLSAKTVAEFDLDVVLEVGARILTRMNPSPK